MKKKQNENKNKKKAFVSMFAIFFSAIIISVLTGLYILLLKQIELMDIDSTSFQALYAADSSFECVLKKEQGAPTVDDSIFVPAHSGSLGYCLGSGDTTWVSPPTITSGRSKSVLNIILDTNYGKFCSTINTDRETRSTAWFTTAPVPDKMTISGQNRDCTDTTSRAVERLVEFVY